MSGRSPVGATVFPECDGDCYSMPQYRTTTTAPRNPSRTRAEATTLPNDYELIPEIFEDDIDDVVQDVFETLK